MNIRFIWLLTCLFVVISTIAQTNTPPTSPTNPFPVGKDAIWFAFIPLVTFILTWLAGKAKSLPKELLPILTPIFGVLVGVVIEKLTNANFPWWSQAGAGAISVMIYETIKGLTGAGPESRLTPVPQTKTIS